MSSSENSNLKKEWNKAEREIIMDEKVNRIITSKQQWEVTAYVDNGAHVGLVKPPASTSDHENVDQSHTKKINFFSICILSSVIKIELLLLHSVSSIVLFW